MDRQRKSAEAGGRDNYFKRKYFILMTISILNKEWYGEGEKKKRFCR